MTLRPLRIPALVPPGRIGYEDSLPHLSLFLYLVTQVEDHLPILRGEVLIGRLH